MPKTGLEPIIVSYKETVLPIKLFRLFFYCPQPQLTFGEASNQKVEKNIFFECFASIFSSVLLS
jgi:hypothetical protein